MSSRRRKEQLRQEAIASERAAAARDQAIRDAGGTPWCDIEAELKRTRHERLVHNDEELRAFRAEEVEFFRTRFGRHFSDGVTEMPLDPETRGYPALVRVEAHRSCWQVWDMEPSDDLVVEYRFEYPEGYVPRVIDMSVHEAALRDYAGELRGTGFTDLENLALNLIEYCLSKNLTGFATIVQNEMQRRLPDVPQAEIQAAYRRAHGEWLEAYCPSA